MQDGTGRARAEGDRGGHLRRLDHPAEQLVDSGTLILPPSGDFIGPQMPSPADQAAAAATAPAPAVSPAPDAEREAQASD